MTQLILGIYVAAAYQRDVSSMIEPDTPEEWMEVACLGTEEGFDIQRRVGRMVIENCSIEQLKTWTDATGLI